MLSWKENKAELGWRRYSHFPAAWTSKRAWVCHSGFQRTHEPWNRASLTSLHTSLSGAAKPKPKQKARSLDLPSGFEIGMVMVRKGSQIRWHSVTCYNYNRNYKAKTQCGSWVKKANSGQTRAQSGQGPGHAIAAMVYVKSWAEGKRMKFNLVLSTATVRNMLSEQAIWTLMGTKSINMTLLTCATKTCVPGLSMKFMKNVKVEDSHQIPFLYLEGITSVIVHEPIDYTLNQIVLLSLPHLEKNWYRTSHVWWLRSYKLCLISDKGRKSKYLCKTCWLFHPSHIDFLGADGVCIKIWKLALQSPPEKALSTSNLFCFSTNVVLSRN